MRQSLQHTLQPLLSTIYETLGPSDGQNLRISSSESSYEKRQAYKDLLIRWPFGNGAAKMLNEYLERSWGAIESFEILESDYPV